MGRLTTTALATGVSASDITNLKAAIRTGGPTLSLAPTTVNGDGTEHADALTLPDSSYLAPASGRKYRVSGDFTVRATIAAAPARICVRSVSDLILSYSGSAWFVVRDGQYVISNKHANFSDYFAADANVPDLSDESGVLSAIHTVENGQTIVYEFDGTIVDLGTDA